MALPTPVEFKTIAANSNGFTLSVKDTPGRDYNWRLYFKRPTDALHTEVVMNIPIFTIHGIDLP